jgi:hypothetical protein
MFLIIVKNLEYLIFIKKVISKREKLFNNKYYDIFIAKQLQYKKKVRTSKHTLI